MAKKKSASAVTPSVPLYTVTLCIADKTYSGKGATAFDALKALKAPQKITYKSVLTVTHGTASKTLPLTIPKAKRLFYSPLYQEIQAKYLTIGLKHAA